MWWCRGNQISGRRSLKVEEKRAKQTRPIPRSCDLVPRMLSVLILQQKNSRTAQGGDEELTKTIQDRTAPQDAHRPLFSFFTFPNCRTVMFKMSSEMVSTRHAIRLVPGCPCSSPARAPCTMSTLPMTAFALAILRAD